MLDALWKFAFFAQASKKEFFTWFFKKCAYFTWYFVKLMFLTRLFVEIRYIFLSLLTKFAFCHDFLLQLLFFPRYALTKIVFSWPLNDISCFFCDYYSEIIFSVNDWWNYFLWYSFVKFRDFDCPKFQSGELLKLASNSRNFEKIENRPLF